MTNPPIPPPRQTAWENLKNCQRQLDADGVEVGVSRQAVDETLQALEAANIELADYAKTVGNLRAALSTCQQSLVEQAAARADPTMPRLTPEVVAHLRANAEAEYALAETSEDRIASHGLSLLCDWQERTA